MIKSAILARATEVAQWDEDCRNMNDEDLIMAWLMGGCPDESSLDDYISIAEDEQMYADVKKLHDKLMAMDV